DHAGDKLKGGVRIAASRKVRSLGHVDGDARARRGLLDRSGLLQRRLKIGEGVGPRRAVVGPAACGRVDIKRHTEKAAPFEGFDSAEEGLLNLKGPPSAALTHSPPPRLGIATRWSLRESPAKRKRPGPESLYRAGAKALTRGRSIYSNVVMEDW